MYEEAKPFIEGLENHQLKLQRCQSCNKVLYYPRHICPEDLGELIYEQVDPNGEIITYSVVERCSEPTLQNKLPFIAAIIKLDVEVLLFGRLVDIEVPLKEPLFSKRVEGVFETQGDEEIIVFKLKD